MFRLRFLFYALIFALSPVSSAFAQTIFGNSPGYYVHAKLPPGSGLIKSFHTTWIVPKTHSKAIVYTWNGLQARGVFMQPVLIDRHGTWTGQSWYQFNTLPTGNKNNRLSHGTPTVELHSGDKLEGVMELISHTDSLYTYKIYFVGHPRSEKVVSFKKPATEFLEAMEAWVKNDPSKYPDDEYIKMTEIYYEIENQPGKFQVKNWIVRPGVLPTKSGKYTVLVDNGKGGADIYFYWH